MFILCHGLILISLPFLEKIIHLGAFVLIVFYYRNSSWLGGPYIPHRSIFLWPPSFDPNFGGDHQNENDFCCVWKPVCRDVPEEN